MARQDIGTGPNAHRPRGAFTLVELLTVVAIISLLLTILIPTVGSAMEIARRAKCATNLKAILSGCSAYGLEARFHRGSKPRSFPYVSFNAGDWYKSDGNKACLWLLIDRKLAEPEEFICPSLPLCTPADIQTQNEFSNLNGQRTFAYAFQSQLDLRLTLDNAGPGRVVVADINPRFSTGSGDPIAKELNAHSPAHVSGGERAGENIGRADGSAMFLKAERDPDTGAIRPPAVSTGNNLHDYIYQSSSPASDSDGKSRGVSSGNASTSWDAIDDVFLAN